MKTLNRPNHHNNNMKKGCTSKDKCINIIKEARKEPNFNKEINKFIKAASGIYLL